MLRILAPYCPQTKPAGSPSFEGDPASVRHEITIRTQPFFMVSVQVMENIPHWNARLITCGTLSPVSGE